ncbi:urease accessory protein UreF [Schizosaccharomyces octosporus yFS286]|uniref:Urease accessory protein UreF n=1 Tax=Schizosaccharomyces octosporus (strain yFS286) TaxID=483514 RepID=S9RGU2_SCHOY|nr:urease accessory protein UreF [Schizosaccharomyces octosporus yFS286]EPX73274.1 urease accessory protein UreF [Schizosaccharomyces octosporus yFS286]
MNPSETHLSLILSDAAFPLSSFSYSFGLESYLSHQPRRTTSAFFDFLPLSLNSLLYTNLPTVKESWETPENYLQIEEFFESTQTCTIGQKVSTMQGKALLGVWVKSFSTFMIPNEISKLLMNYDYLVRHRKALGHFPVIWGILCRALGISLERTCYLYLLNHTKSICSAAVRLDVLSSFQYVSTLVHPETETLLKESLNVALSLTLEDTSQTWYPLDLWQGRHSLLYSRIFNS